MLEHKDWVLAVERAYVASATGGSILQGGSPDDLPRARAALGAIASRYLAVASPRTLGLIAVEATIEDATESVLAHRTWFQPREIRCAGAPSLVTRVDGVASSIEEALACDIVCVHTPIVVRAMQLRRGTHVNILASGTIDDDLRRLATIVEEDTGLGELAAGLVDGRKLDELTVFIAGDARLALAALAS